MLAGLLVLTNPKILFPSLLTGNETAVDAICQLHMFLVLIVGRELYRIYKLSAEITLNYILKSRKRVLL